MLYTKLICDQLKFCMLNTEKTKNNLDNRKLRAKYFGKLISGFDCKNIVLFRICSSKEPKHKKNYCMTIIETYLTVFRSDVIARFSDYIECQKNNSGVG